MVHCFLCHNSVALEEFFKIKDEERLFWGKMSVMSSFGFILHRSGLDYMNELPFT